MKWDELGIVIKKKWRVLIPLLFVLLFSGYLGFREFWRWWAINNVYRDLAREETELKNKSQYLKEELDNLNKPDFLEKEARTRLNLKKEGELVLVVVSENNFPPEDFSKSEAVDFFDKKGTVWFNLKRWRDYFWSE
ncbi:MAG: septum formation initiator family protein [Patescibacteria group bacterium]